MMERRGRGFVTIGERTFFQPFIRLPFQLGTTSRILSWQSNVIDAGNSMSWEGCTTSQEEVYGHHIGVYLDPFPISIYIYSHRVSYGFQRERRK